MTAETQERSEAWVAVFQFLGSRTGGVRLLARKEITNPRTFRLQRASSQESVSLQPTVQITVQGLGTLCAH